MAHSWKAAAGTSTKAVAVQCSVQLAQTLHTDSGIGQGGAATAAVDWLAGVGGHIYCAQVVFDGFRSGRTHSCVMCSLLALKML